MKIFTFLQKNKMIFKCFSDDLAKAYKKAKKHGLNGLVDAVVIYDMNNGSYELLEAVITEE